MRGGTGVFCGGAGVWPGEMRSFPEGHRELGPRNPRWIATGFALVDVMSGSAARLSIVTLGAFVLGTWGSVSPRAIAAWFSKGPR